MWNGTNHRALARWGACVTATDISTEMLDVARDRLRSQADLPTPEFRVMSVFECDLDLRAYDFIIMVNVLGRLSDPGRAIREIASRMGERGQSDLHFSLPDKRSVAGGSRRQLAGQEPEPGRDVAMVHACGNQRLLPFRRFEIVGFRGNHYVPVPRLLFATLPFFWACDKIIGRISPSRCPSVFVECRISEHGSSSRFNEVACRTTVKEFPISAATG